MPSSSSRSKKHSISSAITDAIRAFDRDRQYGPFVDLSRSARWYRAQRFDMNPPMAILKILQKYPELNTITRDNGRKMIVPLSKWES